VTEMEVSSGNKVRSYATFPLTDTSILNEIVTVHWS